LPPEIPERAAGKLSEAQAGNHLEPAWQRRKDIYLKTTMLDPGTLTLFDSSFYLGQNPDIAAAISGGAFNSGLDHFIQFGQFEGRDPSYLFDTRFYLEQNPDVVAAVDRQELTGIEHFTQFGQFEGRDPNDWFDTSYYLAENPDVAAAVTGGSFTSGIEHFIQFGQFEGRDASAPEVLLQVAGQFIGLEVAQTPEQQAKGLMYRPALASERGLLFTFDPPQIVTFFMKNVLIPLDIIFLRDGQVLEIAANVPPCKAEPCPLYFPTVESAQGNESTPVAQVIELRGGRAAELGLQAGDVLSLSTSA